MRDFQETKNTSWSWWASVVVPICVLLALTSIFSARSNALETATYILSGALITAVGFGVLAPMFYRGGNRLKRAVRASGLHLLTLIQVTPHLLEALDKVRAPTTEHVPFTLGQLVRWRMALATDGDELVIVDGAHIEVKLRLATACLANVRVDAVADGTNGAKFPGVVFRSSKHVVESEIELLPVGRGPGGAFPMGRKYCEQLVAWLKSAN